MVHFEVEKVSSRRRHGHGVKIDGDPMIASDFTQSIDLGLCQRSGDNAVLEGIAREDVRETRRDHGFDAHVGERPSGMLAARRLK